MNNENAPSSCLSYLLIVLGIILAVGAALLLSRVDSLQQRSLLPLATLPVVDLEATQASGDLNLIVITGEFSQSELPTGTFTSTPTISATAVDQVLMEETPEFPFTQIIIPTCSAIPEGWTPYTVAEGDSLRSLSILSKISEDSLAQANCLVQPQLETGQIIYLPISSKSPESRYHDP